MSAAERVFIIPELLENILLRIPMKTLLLSQRTCRSFKAIIDGSKPLQRKLFFRPAVGEPMEFIVQPSIAGGNPGHNLWNHKWYYQLPALSSEAENWPYKWCQRADDTQKPVAIYENPISYSLEEILDRCVNSKTPLDISSELGDSEASWRKMLVCQPAIHGTLHIQIHERSGGGATCGTISIRTVGEATLAHLADQIVPCVKYLREIHRELTKRNRYRATVISIPGSEFWEDTSEWDWPA